MRMQQKLLKKWHCDNKLCPIQAACITGGNISNRISHLPELVKSTYLGLIENYHDPKFNITVLARILKYSTNHITRIYKKKIGCPPSKCLIKIRLYKALKNGCEKNLTIKQSWSQAGFNTWSGFEYSKKTLLNSVFSNNSKRKKII